MVLRFASFTKHLEVSAEAQALYRQLQNTDIC